MKTSNHQIVETSSFSGETVPLISLTGISKRFPNGTLALDNLTLQIPQGQLISFIGLSGSGKSTLLRHINGLLRPTTGTVEVMGKQVSSASGRELKKFGERLDSYSSNSVLSDVRLVWRMY